MIKAIILLENLEKIRKKNITKLYKTKKKSLLVKT